MSEHADHNPYSARRIAAGMKHFLMGKALTSVAGVGALLLTVRHLPVEEFAAYSVLLGLTEVLLTLTSVGTGQILTRFVPEIFNLRYAWALRRLIGYSMGLRLLLILLTVIVLMIFPLWLADWVSLERWVVPLQLYMLVVLFRTTSNSEFQILEAMLEQKRGQTAFAAVTVGKFIGVVGLVWAQQMTLTNLILVEIVNEAIGALVMTWGVYKASRNRPGDNTDVPLQREWLNNNMRRMIDFGIKGYTQGLIILPYGGMVNRLVAGNQFTAIQVALFGFAQSIFDQLQRYLPAQLFNGMIRPVMAARYSANGSYQEAETVANAALTVNLVLIGLAATFFAAGGGDLYLWLSKGKYGSDANLLILMMCLVMALESWRHSLENLSHTVERYGFLVFSNLFLGLSLLLGVALAPQFGIVALPAANCVGLVLAKLVVPVLLVGYLATLRELAPPGRPASWARKAPASPSCCMISFGYSPRSMSSTMAASGPCAISRTASSISASSGRSISSASDERCSTVSCSRTAADMGTPRKRRRSLRTAAPGQKDCEGPMA